MNFWKIFIRLLPWRPWPALTALYWQLTRRRVRARNRLLQAGARLPITYALWIDTVERGDALRQSVRTTIASWNWRPQFSVLVYGIDEATGEQIKRSMQSVENQLYRTFALLPVSLAPLTSRIGSAEGDYVVPLRAGDALAEAALFRFAEGLRMERDALLLYGDEDELDRRGRRRRPWFKPRWNAEMFLAQDYVSSAIAIETKLAREAAETCEERASIEELVLAATSCADGPIVHVPHVLCHVDGSRSARPQAERLKAIERHLQPLGARCSPGAFGTVRIKWPLPDALPLVSILVPTRDKLDLLRPCVEGVLARTDYANIELLIVDNASSEASTADYLAEIARRPKVRVLRYSGAYNFSAINNFAVGEARGAYVCLLNNDTEVVEPAWLSEMMRYAVRPEVGAVGAKLLYEDGSIQHAGVVVGIGEAAGHAHRHLRAGDAGYFRQAHVAQFVSAVTAACLVVDTTKFRSVGGLDAEQLRIAFNDVDLCLKLEAAGWRNVYVPQAILVHHESRSRGSDMSAEQIGRYRRELAVLQERWGTRTYQDPLHNPNLDRYGETFVVGI